MSWTDSSNVIIVTRILTETVVLYGIKSLDHALKTVKLFALTVTCVLMIMQSLTITSKSLIVLKSSNVICANPTSV